MSAGYKVLPSNAPQRYFACFSSKQQERHLLRHQVFMWNVSRRLFCNGSLMVPKMIAFPCAFTRRSFIKISGNVSFDYVPRGDLCWESAVGFVIDSSLELFKVIFRWIYSVERRWRDRMSFMQCNLGRGGCQIFKYFCFITPRSPWFSIFVGNPKAVD